MRRLMMVLTLAGMVALAGGILAMLLWHPEGSGDADERPAVSSRTPLRIKGFSFDTYEDERLRSKVSAAELRVTPRRFGPFKIKSFNEMLLIDARFEIHLQPQQPLDRRLFSFGSEFEQKARGLGLRGMGRVTRAKLERAGIDIFRRGSRTIEVRARRGEIELTGQETVLEQAVLTHLPTGRQIATDTLIWSEEERRFRIPGSYTAKTPKGQARGRGIAVDLDFRITKLEGR